MNALAIILARSGSKGLPNKNVRECAGRPMWRWAMEHANRSKSIDYTWLSKEHILFSDAFLENFKCGIVARPSELCTDTATVWEAARHSARLSPDYEIIVILYASVPVRPLALIDRAVALMEETDCDSVQSVSPVGKYHPAWMKTVGPGNRLLQYGKKQHIDRRQDLPPVYYLNGGVIVCRRDLLCRNNKNAHAFLGSDRRAIITQPGEVIDVDNEFDLMVAEAALRKRQTDATNI